MDVVERAKLALLEGERDAFTTDAPSLIAELVEEIQRLRGVLIDGAVDAYKRDHNLDARRTR